MFLDELAPLFQELTRHPVAFLGGLASGTFRLSLADDPVRSWLNEQIGLPASPAATAEFNNGKSSGPQSISID